MTVRVKIAGTGSYLPSYTINSTELAEIIGIKNGEWIEKFLGIEERRYCSQIDSITGKADNSQPYELQMAAAAAKEAMISANINSEEISGLWHVTCTQDPRYDLHFGTLAVKLKSELKINKKAFALSMDSGCGGLVQAMGVTKDMMMGDDKPVVLIIASNIPSIFIDRELYLKTNTWLSIYIFGDGAGAVLLRKEDSSEESGILATFYTSTDIPLMYFHNKTTNTSGISDVDNHVYEINAKMVKECYPILVNESIDGLKEKYSFSLKDIKKFYFHQANKWAILEVAKKLGIPLEKVAINVDKYGNLSAASIAVLLDEDFKSGIIHKNDLILMCGVGAGAHLGAVLYKV